MSSPGWLQSFKVLLNVLLRSSSRSCLRSWSGSPLLTMVTVSFCILAIDCAPSLEPSRRSAVWQLGQVAIGPFIVDSIRSSRFFSSSCCFLFALWEEGPDRLLGEISLLFAEFLKTHWMIGRCSLVFRTSVHLDIVAVLQELIKSHENR